MAEIPASTNPIAVPLEGSRSTSRADTRNHDLRFTGTGGEYFRIWIVNLLLTIVTLGIYSAWAKVRNKRYFYGNTLLDKDAFEYHASPIAILKGRIIAIVALVAYSLSAQFMPVVNLVLLVVFLIVLPWIVVRSLRFNAIMSSWRNVHFNFTGSVGGAAGAYLGWPVFGVITLGLGMPFAWFKQSDYGVNGHQFGTSRFEFKSGPVEFYKLALIIVLIAIVSFLIASGLAGVLMATGSSSLMDAGASADSTEIASGAVFLTVVSILLAYAFIFAAYEGLKYRLVYNNIDIDGAKIRNDVSIGKWAFIAVSNSLLLLVTLGFYYPWAKVRMSRYMIEAIAIEDAELDEFVAGEQQHSNAVGDELGEAFDLGIGV